MNTYLAVDFGGGSGRVMAGTIDNGRLTLEYIVFPTGKSGWGTIFIGISLHCSVK